MATTYLTRSLSSTSTSWTFSAWVKRSGITSTNYLISWGNSGTDGTGIGFNSSDELFYYTEGGGGKQRKTSAKYRDTNAWYHLVVKSSSNAITLYINGEEPTQAWTSGSSGVALDTSTMQIGKWVTSAYYHNGSMSHIHFSDGTAYAPSTFGSTDSTTGEWKINTSPSFTLGTNGFTILKDGNTITDQSSNSNNFSLGGGTLTATKDCPSNVFATLNPLVTYGTNQNALSQGNNTLTGISYHRPSPPTIAVNKGKWYFEAKALSGSASKWWIGLCDTDYDTLNQGAIGATANYIWGYVGTTNAANQRSQGIYQNDLRNGGSNVAISGMFSAGAIAVNDIYAMAVDLDNQKVWYSKNGVWNNGSGTESTTFNASYPDSTNIDANRFYSIGVGAENSKWSINYGNGYFGTTAVSSAGTNASGNGIFEYNVPSGFTSISTKGLNL